MSYLLSTDLCVASSDSSPVFPSQLGCTCRQILGKNRSSHLWRPRYVQANISSFVCEGEVTAHRRFCLFFVRLQVVAEPITSPAGQPACRRSHSAYSGHAQAKVKPEELLYCASGPIKFFQFQKAGRAFWREVSERAFWRQLAIQCPATAMSGDSRGI